MSKFQVLYGSGFFLQKGRIQPFKDRIRNSGSADLVDEDGQDEGEGDQPHAHVHQNHGKVSHLRSHNC